MVFNLKIGRAAVVAPMAAAVVSILTIFLLAEYSRQTTSEDGAGLIFLVAVVLAVIDYILLAVLGYVVPTVLHRRGRWSIRLSILLTFVGVIAQSLVLLIPFLPHPGALSAFGALLVWNAFSGSAFCLVWWWVATSNLPFRQTATRPLN